MHLLESPQDDSYPKGLVSSEHVKRFHQEYVSNDLQKEYFMCGPQGYMDTLERMMPEIGLGDIKIKKESFVSTKLQAKDEGSASPQSETRKVTLIYDDEEYVVEVSPDKTILEAALDADIDLPYSCQSGLCTTCRGKLHSGKVEMEEEEGLSEQEINEGYVLTCVGHPKTDDVKIEIG